MLTRSHSSHCIEYDNQHYWQLTCIQTASLGYPGVIIGKNLSYIYGPNTAILSILIGNLILWLIGITIISMVDKTKSNAIDNVKSYIGKSGGIAFSLILLFAFFNWYAQQISLSLSALNDTLNLNNILEEHITIKIGATLGLLTALLSIGGIKMLRRITVFFFPLLICYTIYTIISSDYSFDFKSPLILSYPAIITSVLTVLPGYINFPTFFRHSRSKSHSYFALSLITLVTAFFQISTIWMTFSNTFSSHILINLILLSLFLLIALTCVNLLNIYLASACIETILPQFSEGKGYAIIGLFGTLTYTFLQISTPVQFVEDVTNSYIAILGVILVMAFLLKLIVRHRPRPLDKALNMATWILGCVIATVYEIRHLLDGVDSLLVGMRASVIFYLTVLFIEEIVWAIQMKRLGAKSR